MISNLQLKNFTAFTDLAIDFSPRINIVIGENGTGKTQMLKGHPSPCAGPMPGTRRPANSWLASYAGCTTR